MLMYHMFSLVCFICILYICYLSRGYQYIYYSYEISFCLVSSYLNSA